MRNFSFDEWMVLLLVPILVAIISIGSSYHHRADISHETQGTSRAPTSRYYQGKYVINPMNNKLVKLRDKWRI